MDLLLGIVGKDFVLVCSDNMSVRSILMMKNGMWARDGGQDLDQIFLSVSLSQRNIQ